MPRWLRMLLGWFSTTPDRETGQDALQDAVRLLGQQEGWNREREAEIIQHLMGTHGLSEETAAAVVAQALRQHSVTGEATE
jgi:uncharacterized protein YoaH (UPF0181 family)